MKSLFQNFTSVSFSGMVQWGLPRTWKDIGMPRDLVALGTSGEPPSPGCGAFADKTWKSPTAPGWGVSCGGDEEAEQPSGTGELPILSCPPPLPPPAGYPRFAFQPHQFQIHGIELRVEKAPLL